MCRNSSIIEQNNRLRMWLKGFINSLIECMNEMLFRNITKSCECNVIYALCWNTSRKQILRTPSSIQISSTPAIPTTYRVTIQVLLPVSYFQLFRISDSSNLSYMNCQASQEMRWKGVVLSTTLRLIPIINDSQHHSTHSIPLHSTPFQFL